ncbi:hypothetical protein LO763_19845 [Glycomyces sp. A-F 0318]|uniref:hypothetical protein n=1 Tax=Glycomyces amatae TaxID=2881355 RepID=UPI001E5FB48E|nr:hypothetical protein [Glycomyces amatae]MCD0445866.1 hypothetical protein [Glycomyces amatae]
MTAAAHWDRADFDRGAHVPGDVVATLEVLLAGDDPVFTALRAQIPFARVVSGCPCGCPSAGLEVDREQVPPAPARVSPIALTAYDDDIHDLVLFTEDGYLSSLELGSVSDEVPASWPDPALMDPPGKPCVPPNRET